MLVKLAAIFFSMILVNNYVLVKFYGICPFLGVSKKLDSAVGMSGAVIFVMFMATAVTFPLQIFVLNPAGLSYLQTIVFILVIAVLVQFIEIFLKKYVVALYNSLGVYLPLITTNCCVLAVTILVVDDYGADVEALGFGAAYIEALVCAIGAGVGFMLAPLENMKVYSDGFQPDGDGATIVAIGSKAKNKARLAKFIDWMYSPEGIYASSSNSGGAACPKDLGCFTTDKDGKNPTLTKFGQQAMTGDHANLKVSAKLGGSSYDDGYSKLNFKAVSQNDIDPNTGEAYNPLLWKSNQDETELFKDWSAHMENATNDIDYLQKAGKLSIAAGASYTTPQEDSTVSATRSSVKSETVNASWQAITAAGKFEKTLDEARTKIDNLGYKEVLKVDQQNAKDLIQARKDIVKQAK